MPVHVLYDHVFHTSAKKTVLLMQKLKMDNFLSCMDTTCQANPAHSNTYFVLAKMRNIAIPGNESPVPTDQTEAILVKPVLQLRQNVN